MLDLPPLFADLHPSKDQHRIWEPTRLSFISWIIGTVKNFPSRNYLLLSQCKLIIAIIILIWDNFSKYTLSIKLGWSNMRNEIKLIKTSVTDCVFSIEFLGKTITDHDPIFFRNTSIKRGSWSGLFFQDPQKRDFTFCDCHFRSTTWVRIMLKMIRIMLKMIQNYQIYQNYQNVAELIQNCVAWCKWCLWCHGLF